MNKPNILVCGTPGTGKTQLCQSLVEAAPQLRHIDLSDLVKNETHLQQGFDQDSQAFILNDDAIVDYLEELMKAGGCVLDTHSLIDYFPERWFELVIVLETDNTLLYDRLSRRGYSQNKVEENVQCEILKVVRDEARESYHPEIVQVLASNTVDDMESNIERIVAWMHMREQQEG